MFHNSHRWKKKQKDLGCKTKSTATFIYAKCGWVISLRFSAELPSLTKHIF